MVEILAKNKSMRIRVHALARLHLGFLDMHGGLGRKFGSLGVSISDIATSLEAAYADDIDIVGPSAERAGHYAEQMLSHYGINGGVKMAIKSAIPAHAGLGSGTQLSLAVATAIAELYGIPEKSPAHLATVLHRGARSGVGIGAFMHGGFIVDAGRGEHTVVPPVISHMAFPEHWRIVLMFDDGTEGINGVPERRAFNTLPPMSEAISAHLCRLTLMRVLPAMCENNCTEFGQAITEIQTIVGDYFSQVQGGRFTSPFLAPVLEAMQAEGATGVGQSSWGPTGFAIFPNETIAFQTLKKVRAKWQQESRLRFMLVKGCNSSADVAEIPASAELETNGLTNTTSIKQR